MSIIIESAQYLDGIPYVAVIANGGNRYIVPPDPDSEYRRALDAWVAGGGVISAADPYPTDTVIDGRIVGEVVDYDGHTPPAGWLECYGQNVLRTTYAALFAALVKSATITVTIGTPSLRQHSVERAMASAWPRSSAPIPG